MKTRLSNAVVAAMAVATALVATAPSVAAAEAGWRLAGFAEASLTGHPLAAPYAGARTVKSTPASGFCGADSCRGAPKRLDVAAADLARPVSDKGYASLSRPSFMPTGGLEPRDEPLLDSSADNVAAGNGRDRGESEVPEPGTYALMVAGLVAIGYISRRRLRQY